MERDCVNCAGGGGGGVSSSAFISFIRAAERSVGVFSAMGFSLVLLFGFVAAVRLGDARHLSRKMPTYWDFAAQKPTPGAEPERRNSRTSAQQVDTFQSQPSTNALTWRFPESPVDPVSTPSGEFEVPRPQASKRVAVRCGENRVQVELKQDLLGIGKPIRPEEITLGGCSPTEVDDWSHVIAFESELHGCGSRLLVRL